MARQRDARARDTHTCSRHRRDGIELYVYGWSEATETPDAVREEVERVVLGRIGDRHAA
jgi:hypothetical protein